MCDTASIQVWGRRILCAFLHVGCAPASTFILVTTRHTWRHRSFPHARRVCPASGPSVRPRALTALVPVLAALTAELHAAVGTGRLAPAPATAATAQLATATHQTQAPDPDTIILAVHLVAARAILLDADALSALSHALTDALAHLHQLLAAPQPPTP